MTCGITVGVHWTQAEFLERALWVEHPFMGQAEVPDRTRRAIFEALTTGVQDTTKRRKAQLRKWVEGAAKEMGEAGRGTRGAGVCRFQVGARGGEILLVRL